MNLIQLRTEVLNHGFDPNVFSSRINQYINDALNLVCRRVDYYVDEVAYDFTTTANTSTYPLPANWARMRSLRDTNRQAELWAVLLRDIDRSDVTTGQPVFYAMNGAGVQLFPIPDGAYSLELRYWTMPPALVNDTDVPTVPADWHHMLWVYATWMCYEAEDDAQMGQYWMQRFQNELAQFAADQKFPNSDMPTQARGMWDQDTSLTPTGWTLWAGY